MKTNDYTKPHTKLYDLLPSVYKSEFNKSLTKTVFDRFLTKPEMVNVVGLLSQNYNDERRIPEKDVQRQNYQLQPLIHNKIATEDYLSSFKDLMGEASTMGIDYNSLGEWASAYQYNFAPPVDLDKQINFQNYYWLSNTDPQYITIKNRFYQLSNIIDNAFVDAPELQSLTQLYINTTDPVEKELISNQIESIYPSFTIIYEEYVYNNLNQSNNIINQDGWDAIVNGLVITNVSFNTKTITINDYYVDVLKYFFNEGIQLEIKGNNYSHLLTINNTPSYDTENNNTIITFYEDIPTNVVVNIYKLNVGNYDRVDLGVPIIKWLIDGCVLPGNYLDQLRDLNTINVSNAGSNTGVYTVDTTSYDISKRQTTITFIESVPSNIIVGGRVDDLGMYDKIIYPINELPNPFNFSLQQDDWSLNNKWVHVSDIDNSINLGTITQAKQPIIEYEPFIELNEWLQNIYSWLYSDNGVDNYKALDIEPLDSELLSFNHTYNVQSVSQNTITIYVPKEEPYFIVDNQITLVTDNVSYDYYIITGVTVISDITILELDRDVNTQFFTASVETLRYSSRGDDWKGFRNHWIYVGNSTPIPCESQIISPIYDIYSDQHNPARYEIITTHGTDNHWYSLTSIYITKFDNIRVYINGKRNYGTYQLGSTTDGINFSYDTSNTINAIWFLNAVPSGNIRIEVGPIAASDENKRLIPVRTSINEPNTVSSISLIRYLKNEQIKTDVNQYPQFNLYNINGTSTNNTDSIWKFLEDNTYNVDDNINKRIKVDNGVYFYEQTLLDEDTGRFFAYKQQGNLFLIWRTDLDNLRYSPKYINTKFEEVAIGDPNGDWELPAQMYENLEHGNRRVLSSVDLFQHFNSMILSQSIVPNYTGGVSGVWRLKLSPEYGAGGHIKEYSNGFDLFLSTLYVPGFNYIQLIEFVKQQYTSNLMYVRNSFCDLMPSLITTTNINGLKDFEYHVYTNIKQIFEENDYLSSIYGDSTMHESLSMRGIRNWVASLVRFGLISLVIPKLLHDDQLNLTLITHHDGHESNISLHNTTKQTIIERILKQGNTGSGLYSSRPSITSAPVGYVFYATDTKKLYKNIIASYGSSIPNDIPLGALWYDTNVSLLKQKTNNGFIVVANYTAWKIIDLNKTLGCVELQFEKALYDICKGVPEVYNVKILSNGNDYDTKKQEYFSSYTQTNQIANPFLNTSFNYDNPFSWNYTAVNPALFLNNYNFPNGVPSTWYNLYEQIYGTRYPHLEPWVLQNYIIKPTWWDDAYNTSHTRKWSTDMWYNIKRGEVPLGKKYPNGIISNGTTQDVGYTPNEGLIYGNTKSYTIIPVNMYGYSTSDGMYKSDDLLPPYCLYTDPDDVIIMDSGALLQTAPPITTVSQSFIYGDGGPVEDVWKHSIDYNYDLVKMVYITNPITFTYITFGMNLRNIGNVSVDVDFNNIPSHKNTIFHGDLVDNFPHIVNGVNQWIVNFLRYKSQDIDISNFRKLWTGWTPVLSYQTGSYVDSRNVIISNDLNVYDNSDYRLVSKKTPSIQDCFLDALRVSVSSVGEYALNYGNQIPLSTGDDWLFKIMTNNPKRAKIFLYGVNTSGSGITFNVLDKLVTTTTWTHYPIDKTNIIEFVPGTEISEVSPTFVGVQGLINFIDGYKAYLESQGFVYNDTEYNQIDPVTGRVQDWQLEIEKLIEQIYLGLATDKLPINFLGKWNRVVVDLQTNELIFAGTPNFNNGELIQFTSTATIPVPLVVNELYEIVNLLDNKFQLKDTSNNIITLQTIGRGIITCGLHKIETTTPQSYYEVNPFKNVVVFTHPRGIVSNINTGSFTDILYQTGIYDQYGRILDPTTIKVYRTDQKTVIKMSNVPDDINVGSTLHMGGLHLYVDGYEHALLFNDTSLEQGLIFDEFLGTRISKLNVNLLLGYKDTMRPNVGGRVNHGNELLPNFESSIHELQYMYDTNIADEQSPITKAGRQLLGYEEQEYLSGIGITPKSQFQFYRGMIQQKGSINAITAYINLRKFIDARVDEYWAYKVGEFGDDRQITKPQLKLNSNDTYTNKLMLNFSDTTDKTDIKGFVGVDSTSDRWVNRSVLQRELFNEYENLFFDAEVLFKKEVIWSDVDVNGYIYHDNVRDIRLIAPQSNVYQFVMDTAIHTGSVFSLGNNHVIDKSGVEIVVSRNNSENYPVSNNLFSFIDNSHIHIQGLFVGVDMWGLEDGDIITIQFKTVVLKESTHYSRINNNYIKFDMLNPVQVFDFLDHISLYGFEVFHTKVTPLRLYDSLAGVDVEHITTWDPAIGLFDTNALHIIDYKLHDPAIYNVTLVSDDIDRNHAWGERFVDKVWLDTTRLRYKPYNDKKIYPSLDQRLQLWGQQHDWSELELYEWISTSIPPSQYMEYVKEQQSKGNVISGHPKQTLFKMVRNTITGLFDNSWIEVDDIILDNYVPLVMGTIIDINDIRNDKINKLVESNYPQHYKDYIMEDYINNGDMFTVYRNGIKIGSGLIDSDLIDITSMSADAYSLFTIIINKTTITDLQLMFNPLMEDDNVTNVWYKYDYKYTMIETYAEDGVTKKSQFYYWVANTASTRNGITFQQTKASLNKTTQPYVIIDNLLEMDHTKPYRYNRMIIRGLVNRVTNDNRFVLQFVRNFTLRDDYNDVGGDSSLKNKHSQWRMFRQRQRFNIDEFLWLKLVETCSGREYNKPTKLVPSLDYILNDELFETSFKYGIMDGQTLMSKTRAIQIIKTEINNPNYDLYPIDRVEFLQKHTFDTPENIENTMNIIYETFLPEHINRIWFAVFLESLSFNINFKNIMKTSWIQLDGVRLLDASGVLDNGSN